MGFDLDNIVVIDTETGGTDPAVHSLLSIALVMVRPPPAIAEAGGDRLSFYVEEPVLSVTPKAMSINQIDLRVWPPKKAQPPRDVCWSIGIFLGMRYSSERPVILCGHNVAFDVGFLKRLYRLAGIDYPSTFSFRTIDTHTLMWALGTAGKMPMCSSLDEGLAHFNIEVPEGARHTALGDALATKSLLRELLALMQPDSATPRRCACGKLIWSGRFTRPADDGSLLRQLCCEKCAVSATDANPVRPTKQPYKLPAKITENRTEAMHHLANSLHQGGCATLTVLAAVQAVNEHQCVPPLPDEAIYRIVTGQTERPRT